MEKRRKDRFLQMNEELVKKIEEFTQLQTKLGDFVQRQDEQFKTLMHYFREVFVQRILASIIPPSLQKPLQFLDAKSPPMPNNDTNMGGN